VKNKGSITFLLPGDNLSGGVRVTARMANLLLDRGYDVRIALPSRWRQLWANPSLLKRRGTVKGGWLHTFRGSIAGYNDINCLRFAPGEVVIAVGTFMIADLQKLNHPNLVKVRYNHGFPTEMTPAYRTAWSLPIPTITVSPTLVPQLEQLSGQAVRAVIPNGIDREQYFPVRGITRDAIGTIYAAHPNKAPRDTVELMRRVAAEWPDVPRVVFSTEPRPLGLPPGFYEQSPTIGRVRELYSRAVVWLLASYTEGLPGPVLEAMACGAVVISTDNDGSLALIRDGENGLIVGKSDFPGFIDRIRRVRENASLRNKLVRGGFATASRYSWDSAARKMEEFLESLEKPALVA